MIANDSTMRCYRAVVIDNRHHGRSLVGVFCAQVEISDAADAHDHGADRHSLRWRSAPVQNSRAEASDAAREVKQHHEQKQRTWLNSARYTLEVDAKSYTGALRKDMERNQAGV